MQGKRKCGIGVDFGTTNSSVALFDGKHAVSVEFPMDNGTVVPSALYFNRVSERPVVGIRAVEEYLKDNEGHAVRLAMEHLGDLDLHVADQTFTFQIHALAEKEIPGRLLRSLKRWLGDKRLDSLQVFTRRHPIVELIARMLSYLGAGVGLMDGEAVYLGRPVHFDHSDDIAQGRLAEATGQAGMAPPTFYPEPVAAAVSYFQSLGSVAPGNYFCFDFGGGTLDVCVLAVENGAFEIKATHGIPLGGDRIDQLIYRKKIFPELGDGCPLAIIGPDGSRMTYRFRLLQYEDELLNWQLTRRLNRPEMIVPVTRHTRLAGEPGIKFRRLHSVIRRNLSYTIFRAIEDAKIRLSEATETTIDVPAIDLHVPFTRAEFESCLGDVLVDIEDCVARVLYRARISPEDVGEVICTGGSSRIPAVRAKLEEWFGKPAIEHQTFTGVALGLAIAHYHGYAPPPLPSQWTPGYEELTVSGQLPQRCPL